MHFFGGIGEARKKNLFVLFGCTKYKIEILNPRAVFSVKKKKRKNIIFKCRKTQNVLRKSNKEKCCKTLASFLNLKMFRQFSYFFFHFFFLYILSYLSSSFFFISLLLLIVFVVSTSFYLCCFDRLVDFWHTTSSGSTENSLENCK